MKKNITVVCIAADLVYNKLGGAELHVVEVIKRLAGKIDVYLFVGPKDDIGNVLPGNVKVVTVDYPKWKNFYGVFYIVWGYFQVVRVLNKIEFDVLWAKQAFPQAQLAALLKLKYKKPLYVTVQNPLLHMEELVIGGALFASFRGVLERMLTPVIGWSLKQADFVAAVSRYSVERIKSMGVNDVGIIPNGVVYSDYSSLKHKRSKKFRIISTSSLIPRNGLDTLIKAVSLLEGINWELVIAGEGPEERRLNKLVKKYKSGSRVKLIGRVGNRDVKKLLKKADLFVRPSRREGFGVSFVEAMASGLPVIGTKVGGIVDFVKHEKTGLLVEPDNADELKQAMIRIFEDERLVKYMTSNARVLVRKKYDWNRIAKAVEKKLLKLAGLT